MQPLSVRASDTSMSYVLVDQVLEMRLPTTRKMILAVLAKHADDDGGSCYPSLNRIAKYSGCHRATVIRELAQLEEQGLIERTRGRPSVANRYRLTLPTSSSTRLVASRDQSQQMPKVVAPCDGAGRTVRPDSIKDSVSTLSACNAELNEEQRAWVLELSKHYSAREIVERIRIKFPTISEKEVQRIRREAKQPDGHL